MRIFRTLTAAAALAVLGVAPATGARVPAPTTAVCVLSPTTANADATLSGRIDITADAATGELSFAYDVTGLSDGEHGIHVHTLGDVSSTDGSATGGHYVGECNMCRGAGAAEQTVGYIGGGGKITSAAGVSQGKITDNVAKLDGVNSIVGRAIVIHGNAADGAPRVAQCAIGLVGANEPDAGTAASTVVLPDTPVSAKCIMTGKAINGDTVTGAVHFHTRPGTDNVDVEWDFAGLTGAAWTFHVHQAGDVTGAAAENTLAHFKGICDTCRPGATNQEVGNLNDGNAWNAMKGAYVDSIVKFTGANSIIGRSVVVHGSAGAGASARVAQCVVGIADEIPTPPPANTPQFAVCNLKPTANNADAALEGAIEFHPDIDGNMHIHYEIKGLSDGTHGWHVHTLGDVSANDGTATGGHFPGSCNACRPAGAPEQTAGLIADGAAITSAGGLAEATVKDTVVKLTGANSIIGRSIVIHGNAGDSGARVAQCVIGINEKAEPVPASASPDDGRAVLGTKVTKATCVFASAVPGAPAITGTATFTATAPTANCGAYETSMTLDVTGLAPGDHTAHVHQSGNVGSTGATDTLGHFVGVCNNCRAQTSLSEVGSFNDGQAFTADAQGKATLTLVDQSMTFSGYNSIIGRSIVIHGDGTTPGARVAQCAIGIAEEKALPDLAPCGGAPVVVDTKRTKAVCTFAETFNNGGTAITGQMSFVATDSTHSSFDVSYDISGLSDGTHGFHVHTLGDLSDPVAAMATGGHFKGDCDSCRPAGSVEQTVGLLGNGQAPITSAGGSAKGTFNDKVIRFAGTNSIIGRSIVIHGNAVDAGARVAQCVVGLDEADEPGSELSSALFETQEARCELRAVSGTASLSDPKNTMVPSGSVIFEMDRDARKTRVIYTMRNLPAGENSWHVHQAGNLLDAKATLGHFVGGCDTDKCRPDGVTQEVGMIGNGDKVYVSDFGAASGYFHDAVLELNGPKSIVGRSVVVHGPDGARLMSCVIGRTQEGTRTASRPEPTAAKCFLRASRFFTGGTSAANVGYEDINLGYLDITERPTTGELEFKYYVEGLSDGAHQFHVHDWGNVLAEDASATGPHFVGRCGGKCRPEGVLQEVGMLQDGKNITASNAIAQGTFVDTVAKLSGPNSIIGRSIVIHGNSSSTGARIAMCVVGVAETNEPSTIPYFAAEEPATVTEAFCHIRPFRPNAPADKTKQVTGTIRFRGGAAPGVSIDYYVAQLPAGPHSWHVHQAGDISDSAAMATLGHFQGACKGCRPAGVTDEVGAIADGAAIIADPHGIAVGKASDGVVSLNGVNSIIGRSIVIHGDGTEAGKGVRIAQCVIGISRETRSSIDIATAAAQSERNSLEAEIAAARAEADAKASSSKATVAGLAIATGVCAIGAVGAIAFAVTKKGVPAGTNRV